ncbi:MAG: polyhydroxyalkanoic acid system family protein [Alphaproteobacteria bacterium]|nr:polyhydroxyalkanoic acid system family protein [Alphaproteobacteria bacterium]
MSQPLVVTISHQLGKQGAKDRIERGIGQIRSQLSLFASSIEDRWDDDRLDLRMLVMGQAVTARVEVGDASVRVEIHLPGILAALAATVTGRIRQKGMELLEKQ